MVKIKSIAIVLIVLCMVVLASSSVFAADLNKVTYTDSKITVEGTCTGNQAQIAIFNSNKEPIYFTTVEVENGKFNSTLPASFDFEEGKTYTVKVGDYEGTEVSAETFVAVEETISNKEEKDETPKTGYVNYIGIITIIISLALLGSSILKTRRA